jgi:hypothetical protein
MNTPDFEVVWPLGRHAPSAAPAAEAPARPRAALDLNSATIAFVWTYNRKGDRMYDIMKGTLRGEYPDIRFVDYDTFGNIHGASEADVVAALPQLLRQHKADIAVIGVAG